MVFKTRQMKNWKLVKKKKKKKKSLFTLKNCPKDIKVLTTLQRQPAKLVLNSNKTGKGSGIEIKHSQTEKGRGKKTP